MAATATTSQPIRANVWDSDDKVQEAIRLFTYVQVCSKCNKYFCELDNLGTHQCRYHPGEFDPATGRMTCCQEKLNGNIKHQYSHFKINIGLFICEVITGTPKPLKSQAVKWIKKKEIKDFAFPTATHKLFKLL